MLRSNLTRTILSLAVVAVVVAALFVVQHRSGGSSITEARLERSLPTTFSHLYLQQADLLGRTGLTMKSLDARADCDKGGPTVANSGPGADWICLMTWNDPDVPLPDGSGKFELNVHSNDCYTAGGPSKLVGLVTIVDRRGREVPNPVFEFDGCFDPNGDDTPTGVTIVPPPVTAPTSADAR
ncbi:MAG: hypothetical protein JWN72_1862 [Thermoleophilia bacterium]|nr:hypothetical protein [Thermoleophilia bacterium]